MFLHLGNNYLVKNEDIIGIFDIRNKKTNIYKFFLKPKLEVKDDRLVILTDKYDPSSCIVTKDKIILSAISSMTLKNRQI